jgi:hypothetical protein
MVYRDIRPHVVVCPEAMIFDNSKLLAAGS